MGNFVSLLLTILLLFVFQVEAAVLWKVLVISPAQSIDFVSTQSEWKISQCLKGLTLMLFVSLWWP